MKINIYADYNVYKNKVLESAAPYHAGGGIPAAARSDRNSITRGSTTMADKQLLMLKSSVQSYVSAPAGSVHLEEIRAKVQSGAYYVATSDLVNAIMLDE